MLQRISIPILGLALLAAAAAPAVAGVKLVEKDDKWVEIGGRIQLQYHMVDPDGGDSEDELFFRRLRPYIEASITKNWAGKIEFDFGEAEGDNEVKVKDAYMEYSGFKNLTVILGNSNPTYSREFITSSKRQQLIERTFVGDHNYGSPDRVLGLKLEGHNDSKKVAWAAMFGSEDVDPDAKKLDFDTPVNPNSDFNQGWIVGGRVDFHPLGAMKYDQGSFGSKTLYTISLGAFSWANDDDNNTFTSNGMSTSSSKADIDTATGFEISGGLRTGGLSLDAQYNLISADTVDNNFTGGLYRDGSTDLDVYSLEGGYMFQNKFEVVLGYQSLDADNYADSWNRTSVGFNYFWAKHDVKWQLTYQIGENLDGVAGRDANELFLQWQYVF
ncbi:MAG: hypothetical protein KDD47_12515 [Acidobacteria bacterium]|nr:hypothetical protein [Acidobacteriota bacterium]